MKKIGEDFKSLSFYSMSTGEKLCEFDMQQEPIDLSMDNPCFDNAIQICSEGKLRMSAECLDREIYQTLIDIKENNKYDNLDFYGDIPVDWAPARIHKKKRIKKKWLKRYGYKPVYQTFKMKPINIEIFKEDGMDCFSIDVTFDN